MKCRTPAAEAAATDSRTDTKSISRNCFAFAGLGCGTPTICTNVSAGAIAGAKVAARGDRGGQLRIPPTVCIPAGPDQRPEAMSVAHEQRGSTCQ